MKSKVCLIRVHENVCTIDTSTSFSIFVVLWVHTFKLHLKSSIIVFLKIKSHSLLQILSCATHIFSYVSHQLLFCGKSSRLPLFRSTMCFCVLDWICSWKSTLLRGSSKCFASTFWSSQNNSLDYRNGSRIGTKFHELGRSLIWVHYCQRKKSRAFLKTIIFHEGILQYLSACTLFSNRF